MLRSAIASGFVVWVVWLGGAASASADDVFEVCKGESRTVVAGTGRLSIAVVYPEDFPVKTNPVMRNAVGARLATAEKAKIVPAVDVEAAKTLVGAKRWTDKSDVCGQAPSLVAVLGQKHPNLSTAWATVVCDDKGSACELRVDLERHGRPSAERWVRYSAPLTGAKDKVETYTATAGKLANRGVPPDRHSPGMAVAALPTGKVTVRSNIDGALELDRAMEASAAIAACGPKNRKPHDVRGYWAEWKLGAKGNAYQAMVKPFAGRDPADAEASDCLKRALEATPLACPRDGKPVTVRTAICL